MLQGGDIIKGDGTGEICIYGKSFADESYAVKHCRPGLLSMANSGPHTNNSQFFITTNKAPHLDDKHVGFGMVTKNLEALWKLEECGSASGGARCDVTIVSCGIHPKTEWPTREKDWIPDEMKKPEIVDPDDPFADF